MNEQYILVVDDEPDIRHLVQEILEDEGYIVAVAGNCATAREMICELKPRMMLLDIWMPDEDGISLLKSLKKQDQLDFPVVMMSGHGTVETAVEATRVGAIDFIEKPLSLAKLLLTVEKALTYAKEKLGESSGGRVAPVLLDPLIGKSEYNQNLIKQIAEASEVDQCVCISGPPATGKRLVAKHIYAQGKRSDKPYIQLSCDSLSKSNAARELLGDNNYGSLNNGYIDAASGGTLVLVEVEYLPISAQTILLDILMKKESQKGRAVGQDDSIRIIATSSMGLGKLVGNDKLMPKLYEHINEISIRCLPLSERQEDIPLLLDYYVNWFVGFENLAYRHFSVAAQNRLRNHSWPKNLIELKNLVQRLLIVGTEVDIDLSEVEEMLGTQLAVLSQAESLYSELSLDLPLREARAAFEKIYMLHQLKHVEGNIGELAKRVGMERTHLYRKLRGLGIDLESIRD